MSTNLSTLFTQADKAAYLFGTCPPKAGTSMTDAKQIAEKLLARLKGLNYEGIIVYDIQDESSRTQVPRPFPFIHTLEPPVYAKLLQELSGKPVITYKSVGQTNASDFQAWLDTAQQEYNIENIVLVGSPSAVSDTKLNLNQAYELLSQQDFGLNLGAVTIAERHLKKGNEQLRLLDKAQAGVRFFVSQAVYDAEASIKLLQSYAQACKEQGQQPQRIILTFTPCGSAKTLEFMNWLGISVPTDTTQLILNSEQPLTESIKVCEANLKEILMALKDSGLSLGLNIESLTNRKEEIEASIELYKRLQQLMDKYYPA